MRELAPIAMFGEAEKGRYERIYFCETVPQLHDHLGQPPEESRGIYYAVQALLYEFPLLYIRVREEGFSHEDYLMGLRLLEDHAPQIDFHALFAPGVGDPEIIDGMATLCGKDRILITTEPDLFDYLSA